jgi:hypothetical protein
MGEMVVLVVAENMAVLVEQELLGKDLLEVLEHGSLGKQVEAEVLVA